MKTFEIDTTALLLLLLLTTGVEADEYEKAYRAFKYEASNLPRGVTDIPAQWFMMKGLTGWEEMMLIFGYADNASVCDHLQKIAKNESPSRDFLCLEAN